MPVLYQGNAGRVIAVPDQSAAGLLQLVNLQGVGGIISYSLHGSIITGVETQRASNAQFNHTVGNAIYASVFGDRVGQMIIKGTSFPPLCGTDKFSDTHGFEKLWEWYNSNRIAYSAATVRAILGRSRVVDGFLLGMTTSAGDAESRSTNFTMTVSLLP